MSFQYLADPSGRPAWSGVLPGTPRPYFLRKDEGEHAKVFTDTFTVLLSADETGGQFGLFTAHCPAGDIIPTHAHDDTHETFYIVEGKVRVYVQMPDGDKTSQLLSEGDFGFVPAGAAHAYRVEAPARILGAATGGFERFFQQMGTPADTIDMQSPPYVPKFAQMRAAAQTHNMRFMPEFDWPEA
jgi:quercetin 2,3-dioxygenase